MTMRQSRTQFIERLLSNVLAMLFKKVVRRVTRWVVAIALVACIGRP